MIKAIVTFFTSLFVRKVSDKNKETTNPAEKIHRPLLKPYDRDRFELVENYTYKDTTVPAGFYTNGANIPRLFWSLFPPNLPEYLSAALVHDFLCEKEEYIKADTYLKEMMTTLGCSRFKINCFYWSVRAYHKIRYGK